MSRGGVGAAFVLVLISLAVHADPPPMQAYAALPAIQGPRLSPDGMSLALMAPVNERLSLITRKVDSLQAVVLNTGDTQPDWFLWKTNNRLIASVRYSAFSGNHEYAAHTRLAFIDADGGNAAYPKFEESGTGAPQFQDRIVGLEPRKPNEILMAVAFPNNVTHPELWRVDIHTGASNAIDQRQLAVQWFADDSGDALAVTEHRWDRKIGQDVDKKVFVREREGEPWRVIDENDQTAGHRFVPIGFAKDRPSILYVLTDLQSRWLEAREYDISSRTLGAVLASGEGCDAERLGSEQESVGVAAPCNSDSVHYFDPGRQHDYLVIRKALQAAQVQVIDRSEDGKRALAAARRTPAQPVSYWILDRHGDKPDLSLLGDSYEGVKPEDIRQVKEVFYPSRDEQRIPGFLTVPVDRTGPLPFVVLIHDGPTANDGAGFNWQVQFLVSRGYGVFQPQFRGSSGFGARFQEAGARQWSGRMADDIADGTRWLISQKLADPSRICIVGAGFGGYSALMGAIKEPSLYACSASYGGISDLDQQVKRMKKFIIPMSNWPVLSDNLVGPAEPSPADHAAEIKIPVLLVHGRKDVVVPPEQSEEMEAALRRAGKPVTAVYSENGDSILSRSADRALWLGELSKFLAANLHPAQAAAGSGLP